MNKINKSQFKSEQLLSDVESLPTTSARIRYLYGIDGEQYSMYRIAKMLGIAPQHVRQVLVTPYKGRALRS